MSQTDDPTTQAGSLSGFCVLKAGLFTQYRYSWYEPLWAKYEREWPKCPACGGAVGGMNWLTPRRIRLKQARRIGDLVAGPGGSDLIVSRRFLDACLSKGLTGIVSAHEVDIRNQRYAYAPDTASPPLFAVWFEHTLARVATAETKWMNKPSRNWCRVCGPDGGSDRNGCSYGFRNLSLESGARSDKDLFYAMNRSGVLLASPRAVEFIHRSQFTNAILIPMEQYSTAGYEKW
jgi:hypothetical protein